MCCNNYYNYNVYLDTDDDYDDDYDEPEDQPPSNTTSLTPAETEGQSFPQLGQTHETTPTTTTSTESSQTGSHTEDSVQEPGTETSTTPQTEEQEAPPLPGGLTKEELIQKVKKLFPGFTPSGILRFSSLLGPGKQSSMPRIWEGCRKPKPKSKSPKKYNDPNERTFNFANCPSKDMLDDDAVAFLAPIDSSDMTGGGGKGGGVNIVVDEMTSEWRFGPAQYWYDLFGFPEDGRGFDYGFRMKVRISYICIMLTNHSPAIHTQSPTAQSFIRY